MAKTQQREAGLVKMLFPSNWDILLAATSTIVFFPVFYLRFLFYPGVCFAIGILIQRFSLYSVIAIALLWLLGANYREFSHYTGGRRKLLKIFYEDFIEKYPFVKLTEVPEKEIEFFLSDSYYLNDEQKTFRRPGFNKEIDMHEQRVALFVADYSECESRPSAQLSFSTYTGSSFIVFNEKPENLGDSAKFFLHHEIGHSSFQGKETLISYFPFIFLLLTGAIYYCSTNNIKNVYLLFGSVSWIIATVLLTKSRTIVNQERSADAYAVLNSADSILQKVKTSILKYPKLLFDKRMSFYDNNLRKNYLLELIELKLGKKNIDWLQITQNEQVILNLPFYTIIGFSLCSITSCAMFTLAGLSLNAISAYTLLLYVILFIFRAVFVTTSIVYEKKIKELSGLPMETRLFTKSKSIRTLELFIMKD